MLEIRPIVVNKDMIVLGGNMRLKACQEANLKDIPVMIVDLDESQQSQFIIKDNIGFGEWDWDLLANTFDTELLDDWGLDVWQPKQDINLDDFFNDAASNDDEPTSTKLILEFTQSEFDEITAKLNSMSGSKESIIYKLVMES